MIRRRAAEKKRSEGGLSSPRQIREGAANDGIYTSTIIFEQLQSNINLQLYHNSPWKPKTFNMPPITDVST